MRAARLGESRCGPGRVGFGKGETKSRGYGSECELTRLPSCFVTAKETSKIPAPLAKNFPVLNGGRVVKEAFSTGQEETQRWMDDKKYWRQLYEEENQPC